MNKKYFLIPFLLLFVGLSAHLVEAAKPIWVQRWGGSGGQTIADMVVDSSGNSYVLGNNNNRIFKLSSDGSFVWASSGISVVSNIASSDKIVLNPQQTFLYLLGSHPSVNGTFRVAQYDTAGNFVRAYDYFSPSSTDPASYFYHVSSRGIHVDTQNNVYITGTTYNYNASDPDPDNVTVNYIRATTARFDAGTSTPAWSSISPENTNATSYNGKSLVTDSTNNYLYVLGSQGTGAAQRMVVWKYASSSFTPLWRSEYLLSSMINLNTLAFGIGSGYGIYTDSTSTIYITTQAGTPSSGTGQTLVLRGVDNGSGMTVDWLNILHGVVGGVSAITYIPGDPGRIIVTSSSLIVAGGRGSTATSTADGRFSRFSRTANGISSSTPDLLESTRYDSGLTDDFEAIGMDSSGFLYLGGTTNAGGSNDYLVMKYGPGCSGSIGFSNWTDAPTLSAGTHSIRSGHFSELRTMIQNLRIDAGLGAFNWTDSSLTTGIPVKKAHLDDMRSAIGEAFTACGRAVPTWTDPTIQSGVTPIRAVHINELRQAVFSFTRP